MAACIAVVQHVGIAHAPMFVLQPLPQGHRKRTEIGHTSRKRLNFQLVSCVRAGQSHTTLRQVRGLLVQTRTIFGCGSGNAAAHVGSTASAAYQIALYRQLIKRSDDCVAR